MSLPADTAAATFRKILFVSCCKGAKEQTLLFRSLNRLGIAQYRFIEHNRDGLSECYNRVLDEFAMMDRIIVFVHSDVSIGDLFLHEKLAAALRQFDIVGVVGSAHFDFNPHQTSYAWPNWPREALSGAVEHPVGNGITQWLSFGPAPRRCIILDGVLLAIDMLKIGKVRFDPRFSFHLYDIDFCLTAHFANLTLGTANLHLHHESVGDYQSVFYSDAVNAFRIKWATVLKSLKPQ